MAWTVTHFIFELDLTLSGEYETIDTEGALVLSQVGVEVQGNVRQGLNAWRSDLRDI